MKILSSYTHPQVVSNLYEFLSSAEHKAHTGLKQLEGEYMMTEYFILK